MIGYASGTITVWHMDVEYDENSNILSADDTVYPGQDVKYDIDNLDRVTKADEGTLSAGSISTRKRYEDWTLSHTGQWAVARKDLDGDNNFNETVASVDELDEANTLGSFTYWGKDNSIKARNTDNSGGADVTLTYDKVGQRTADGVGYTYVYDAFGRLRKVYSTGGGTPLVIEYRYNGLNQRIGWHYDVDDGTDTGTPDGVVDSDDYWYYWLNNEKWQQVATFRHDTAGAIDTYPKEVFIYHNAGLDGQGGSSYVDSTILRDGDADLFWEPGATTLAERRYYLQNWRADVVGFMTTGGVILERQKYSAYGQPRWWSPADGWEAGSGSPTINPDGFLTGDDFDGFIAAWAASGSENRWTDLDADGDEDSTDLSLYDDIFLAGSAVTRGLSLYDSRKGFAAYEFEPVIAGPTNQYHVRNRVLDSDTGQWTRRDPAGYGGGSSLVDFVESGGPRWVDPSGRRRQEPPSPRDPDEPPAPVPSVIPVPEVPDPDGTPHPGPHDRLSVDCYPVPIFPYRHCRIKCCRPGENPRKIPGKKGGCTTYSLHPTNPFPIPFGFGPVDRGPNHPVEQRNPGTEEPTIYGAAGLCDCLKKTSDANQPNTSNPWTYNPTNCNSNWYASAMLRCCTGVSAPAPAGALGWAEHCCRDEKYRPWGDLAGGGPRFSCPGFPGAVYIPWCNERRY